MAAGTHGLKYFVVEPGTLLMQLNGNWNVPEDRQSALEALKALHREKGLSRIEFDTRKMGAWNSGLLTFLINIHSFCVKHDIEMTRGGLPQGVTRILALSLAVPPQKETRDAPEKAPLTDKVGQWAIDWFYTSAEMVDFIGQAAVSCLKMVRGSARFRMSDLVLYMQQCGAQALPIVSLISLLVGLILAFVGAVQLQMFGAQIYVANLVGLAMAREMGAMMTGIIMAGRTGAAFAAQLGTMQVNEEIDAFKTMGIDPVEFLVLPRMLALVCMMPFLCIYADLMGIAGGALVSVGMLDISAVEYYHQTREALNLVHFGVGVFKSAVFGVLVAIAGCLRGMQCGRSSSAVGDAATSAVVTGIIFIIVSDALMTVVFTIIGI
ncbi:MAG: ABC transporter permease [Deltaproteobacteria bacterium]|nr:ABC transporter permease [Deltaproteobacteria bacterium]